MENAKNESNRDNNAYSLDQVNDLVLKLILKYLEIKTCIWYKIIPIPAETGVDKSRLGTENVFTFSMSSSDPLKTLVSFFSTFQHLKKMQALSFNIHPFSSKRRKQTSF